MFTLKKENIQVHDFKKDQRSPEKMVEKKIKRNFFDILFDILFDNESRPPGRG